MSAAPPEAETILREVANVSRETLGLLADYVDLLEKWQSKINLVSKASLEEVWMRHVVDSAQLWPLARESAKIWTDLGSGAGFPGLVIAILGRDRPGLKVHLIESDQRKAAFLREVIRVTGAPAQVHAERIEALEPWASDVVMARALAPLEKLLPLAKPFVGKQGIALFLKGKAAQSELTAAQRWGTFEVEVIPSRTATEGTIVKLCRLSRAP
ncbi:16S rRNA (guanine(527)-N(7))-methyltransferase RsmG [bacterium AH-315-P15]|nr:16S rRNA (guanine(527)-N(7))-methyltransferase RsmG [bacterium AH-315-P15]